MIKIFFTTDIHGSERCFRKFVNAGKFYNANILILGGDITGKGFVPIVRLKNGYYEANYQGNEEIVSKDELPKLEEEIRFNGLYPYVTTEEELEVIEKSPEKRREIFKFVIKHTLEEWMVLATERLKPLGIKIFVSPGNDDDPVVDDALFVSKYVINPDMKVIEIYDNVEMLSYGYSNPTPWNSPREKTEEEIYNDLKSLAGQMDYNKFTIFNIHVPPFNTPLDIAPKLDKTLKPVVEGGSVATENVGSKSVRRIIEEFQPDLGLHGHVHESPGSVKIGKTLSLNPGSEYSDGILRGVLINLDEKKKKFTFQFTMG
ncbi:MULTISPECIES: metallophosphoesterase family protein [unclassified Caldisericum]|jgi:Icc-related predicted phosphoesterase|uniref:Metallophosphoesterase n=1 Tax=Caldisericum exile TaxID=693075 RepID=A0A2J6WFI5_9BACT|nr:MAG: metallophosphoesterase [Caldisericum exile]